MVHLTIVRRLSSLIRLSEQVQSALDGGRPIVALESTVITHGLPYPKNIEVGRELERIVRDRGATPATIALISGQIRVGLSGNELEEIGDPKSKPVKVSSRDIPNALATKLIGGTTVAATTKIAAQVGIKVFATGGIGGVHRGAKETFDISADLIELGRNPVAVVCAGAKSILDIPKTLEFLETVSTNVIVYDKEPWFPGFFTRRTSYKAPFNTDSLDVIAQIIRKTDDLKFKNGTLIACPLPVEFENESGRIEQAVEQAIQEAKKLSISGKEMTPFLLKRVNELTDSVSMKLNIELLKNNAKIATELAKKLSNLERREPNLNNNKSTVFSTHQTNVVEGRRKPKILCVGGSIYDMEVVTSIEPKNDGSSYPSTFFQRAGGVARNHAEAFTRLGCDTSLISVVGNDIPGQFIFPDNCFMNTEHIFRLDDIPTSTYLAINVNGNIRHGFSAIEETSKELTPSRIESKAHLFEEAEYVLLEGNLQAPALQKSIELCGVFGKKVWYDPTDLQKVWKIVDTGCVDQLSAFSPNANEFVEYCKCLGVSIPDSSLVSLEALAEFMDSNKSFLQLAFPDKMQILLITMGVNGCLLVSRLEQNSNVQITTIQAPTKLPIISASGSGDCFNSAFLTALLHGASLDGCMCSGQRAAGLSLQSLTTVPESIKFNTVIEPFLEASIPPVV